jgi:hypothetical protein
MMSMIFCLQENAIRGSRNTTSTLYLSTVYDVYDFLPAGECHPRQ